MDMLPDENQDLPQPANDSSESQPSGAPEMPPTPETRDLPQPVDDSSESQPGAAPETSPTPETQAPAEPAAEGPKDAFAEFRRELREEETQEKPGLGPRLRRLLSRIFKRKKKPVEEEAPSRLDELIIPEKPAAAETAVAPEAAQEVAEVKPEVRPEGAAAEFRSMVRTKLSDTFLTKDELEPTSPPPEVLFEQPGMQPITPAAEPSVEEGQAPGAAGRSILSTLREGEEEEAVEEPSTIREAALEDYVTAPPEGEVEAGPSVVRTIRRSWRDMRPIDRRLLVGALIIIGLAVLSGSTFLVINSGPTPTPAPTATASIVPIPISISLPGGWVLPLGIGVVDSQGRWNPSGPQWLQGTEVCRWVSLPWTVQLEAVLRTLKASDEIKLSMSNYDSVTYRVESIQQVPSADVGKLAPTTPSLLVILSKQDSSTRWVVVAKP